MLRNVSPDLLYTVMQLAVVRRVELVVGPGISALHRVVGRPGIDEPHEVLVVSADVLDLHREVWHQLVFDACDVLIDVRRFHVGIDADVVRNVDRSISSNSFGASTSAVIFGCCWLVSMW